MEKTKEPKEPTPDEKVLIYYDYLRGYIENIRIGNLIIGKSPKLSDKKAFNILYYAQEFLRTIPDKFEKCSKCGKIYDTETEGWTISEEDLENRDCFKKCDLGCFYCEDCLGEVSNYQDRKKERKQSIGNIWMFEVKQSKEVSAK